MAYTPFVSVVVPAYNERENIAACIESLLAQEYPAERREIIIVDNNSTDGMDEVIKRYPVTLLYEREMQTPAASRNTGIRHAQGEIVALTDGDCQPRPDWLRRIVVPFADPNVVGVAGRIRLIADETLLSTFQTKVSPTRQAHLNGLWYVATANCAYRRDVLVRAGLFQPRLYTGEDIELGLRIQLNHYGAVVGADDAVVEHASEDNLHDLCERFRRYGYSELLLDTLYRDEPRYYKRPSDQVRLMLRQCRSLLTYPASFVYRTCRSVVRLVAGRGAWDEAYVAWPLLWFAAEGSSVLGKLRGILVTHFFRRLPTRSDLPV